MKMKSDLTKIWYTFCPVCCVSNIAHEKELLKDEFVKDGIELSHINDLPIEEWQVHFTHNRPDLFRDGGNIPPLWTMSEGADVKVIGMTWSHGHQDSAILVADDSSIKSVAELKGKRIGLVRRLPNLIDFRRATEKRVITMSLKAHGLLEEDITFVDLPVDIPDIATKKEVKTSGGWSIAAKTNWAIPQQPEIEALQRGKVDAIITFNKNEAVLVQKGLARVIYNLDDHPDWKYSVNGDFPCVITVSGNLVREHPNLVNRWMKILVQAGTWAKDNYHEVVKIMSKATNLSEEIIEEDWPSDFHKNMVPEISDRAIEALEIEKNFLKEHGFINNDFDVRNCVDSRFVDEALKEL